MSQDSLQARGKALEASFFQARDKQLVEKLREELAAKEKKEALSAAARIMDERVIEQLLASQIHVETLAALSLFPLVAVAWADGTMDAKERDAILSAANEDGLLEDEPSYQLLEHWLDEMPGPHLLDTWKEYVRSLCKSIGKEESQSLKNSMLGHARNVAEAAGGFLGLGNKVSQEEAKVLEDLESAFG